MVIIRKARIKDVDEIVELWKEFMREHAKKVLSGNPTLKPYTIMQRNAADNFKEFLRKSIRSKNGIIFVAESENKLVGYILSLIKKNIPVLKLERFGYISDLFVKKEYRGNKISSIFKNESIKWFREKGIKHASIIVNSENMNAYKIYRKWGFHDYHIELRRKI